MGNTGTDGACWENERGEQTRELRKGESKVEKPSSTSTTRNNKRQEIIGAKETGRRYFWQSWMQDNTGENGNGDTEMTRHVQLTGETGPTSATNSTYHL